MRLEEIVGANVAEARERRKLSQAELGELLGQHLDKPWARQAVSAAEKGRRAFAVSELVALALALDVTLFDLLAPSYAELGDRRVELPGSVIQLGRYAQVIEQADAEEVLRQADIRTLRTLIPTLKQQAWTTQLLYSALRDLFLDPSVREQDEAEAREQDSLIGSILRDLKEGEEKLGAIKTFLEERGGSTGSPPSEDEHQGETGG
ncbi:helix-turn-helix transcriptional regulator [Streptantibioticus rubrisoli]|uniref:Helix-turn-helix domain-containing protein n=1 Tax=Streptantibioticus rubrisoli TaxID=1387313 RepID=A0ABT1PEN4_9ACTN|nr:helix-turn-helix transcriptional regulator [Streptantibioticus rubrisoli]MCQ4043840.1 helix-turn-helix domain-containing protein [Streptantibioticus rubrisoli]